MTENGHRCSNARGGRMVARALFTRSMVAAAILTVHGGTARAVAGQQTQSLPRPPGVRVVTLPREPGDRPHETAVAVNPRDPQHVVVSYQRRLDVHPPFAAAGVMRFDTHVAWSADGGEGWTVAQGTAPANYLMAADASATFDLHGHVFLVYVTTDNPWRQKCPVRSGCGSRGGVFVRRSLDGGRTWERSHIPLDEYPTKPDPPFQDHFGYVFADNHPSSPHAGNLYVSWYREEVGKGQRMISRSTDDGKTWSRPMGIGAGGAFRAAVGRDGTVYAIGFDDQAILLTVSRDGGRTFAPARRVVPTHPRGLRIADFPTASGFPAIAIDPRSTPARLFVAWVDRGNRDIDVLASTSADGGNTWTPPVRVNDDPRHNGKDQVMSSLAVDPTDGAAYVLFYDRRGDPKNLLPTMTLARSTDGGRTFTNYAWSVAPSDPKRAYLGDYIGIAALGGRVYGAWTENATEAARELAPTPVDSTLELPRGGSIIRIGTADFRSLPQTAEPTVGRQ